MRLVFDRDSTRRRVLGRFRLGAEFQGGAGFIHGGIIATVLDEAMGKVSRFSDVRTVTVELNIQYLRPIRVDEEIQVEAYEKSRNGKHLIHLGEIRNGQGEMLAKATGRFVVVDPKRYAGLKQQDVERKA